MPKRIHALLLVASAIVTSVTPVAAFAAGGGYHHVARRGGGEAGVSLNQAVQQVQRETGGRVLSAETIPQNGRMVHRIKVLTPSGQVRVVVVDAQSGGR